MDLQQGGTERPLSQLEWRPMTPGDIDGVVAVARLSFPDHFEARECFAERQQLAPEGCFVLSDAAGAVMGYLMAYPWKRNAAPPLDSLIGAVPEDAEVVYLHDLAVAPRAHGGGVARALLRQARQAALAAGLRQAALVSVQDSRAFWQKQGFAAGPALTPAEAANLASYPPPAFYLSCRFD